MCYIDDNWHTNCHKRSGVVILPYRYNIEIFHMNKKVKGNYQIEEENKTVFVHMMGNLQKFYNVFDNYDNFIAKESKGCKMIHDIYVRLFKIKRKLDNELNNLIKRV